MPSANGDAEDKPAYPLVLERRQAHDVDAEIKAHLAEVQRLAHETMCAQENERRDISRELHDNIAQIICSVTNRITLAKCGNIPAWLRQELQDLQSQLDTALEDVRTLARDLRPHLLDTGGFAAALGKHIDELRSRTRIAIEVDADTDTLKCFGKNELTHIYRLIQEALQNVEDHSGATEARIILGVEDGMMRLEIHDNGCSFTPERVREAQHNGHLGLLGMRERAELLGGTFLLEAKPRHSTTIRILLPLKQDKP